MKILPDAYMRFVRPLCTIPSGALPTFKRIVGDGNVITGAADLEPFNTDWLDINKGKSEVMVRPSSSAEVSGILSYCNKHGIGVVPQGGNTGVVHGSIPLKNEVILGLSRMNKILSFNTVAGVLQCEAGCILQSLHDYVGEHGFLMPYDLGAKGSCQIGGNVATAAGGINFVRFGRMEGHILGLEVVLPSGQVVDMMSSMRKDNCGYHLPHLFIGSEGTLGVITKVAITCHPAPRTKSTAFVGCESFAKCLEILQRGQQELGNDIYAFEFVDKETVELMRRNMNVKLVLSEIHPFHVLVEIGGREQAQLDARLTDFLTDCMESSLVDDGVVAADYTQARVMWALREGTPTEALRMDGHTIKQDFSLPPAIMYDVVTATRERLRDFSQVKAVVGYGHIADGNIHLNVTVPSYDQHVYDRLFPWMYEWVAERKGSISAEHGIGSAKRKYLSLNRSPAAVELMRTLKMTLDPNGILNPGKVL